MNNMIVDELKKAILQYAIQGKLTKQLESDEILDLKFKIKDEKSIIPKSWNCLHLCDVLKVKSGEFIPNDKRTNGKYPVYGGNGITSTYDKHNVTENTLIIGRVGYYCGNVQKTITDSWITDNALIVEFLIDKYNINYFKYLLNHIGLNKNNNATAQPVISGSKISKILLPIPPIEEQQRIVERIEKLFSRLDELKDTEVKLYDLKNLFPEEMKQSILQCAIEGKLTDRLSSDTPISKQFPKLNFYSDEGLFQIPNEWKWIKFKDLVDYSMGKTPPRKDSRYWGNDYSWISIADMITDGNISKTKEKVSQQAMDEVFKGRISKPGTLIMSFKLTVGKVSILEIEAVHNEAIISIYPKNDENNCIRNYLFKVLPVLVKYGDTKGAIKGNTLNSKSIDNLLIPLPSIEEQQRIVEKLDSILSLIGSL